MTDENFFKQIKEEQQKQKDRLSALQKILNAPLKEQQIQPKKSVSWIKKVRFFRAILARKNQMIIDR